MKTFREWWLAHSGCESDDDERSADTKFSWDALPAAKHLLSVAEEYTKEMAGAAHLNSDNVYWCQGHRDLLNHLKSYITATAPEQGGEDGE